MKKVYLILAAAVGMTITSCTTNDYVGDVANTTEVNDGSIQFGFSMENATRADIMGNEAAKKLGYNFYVAGTKGSEQTNSPSTQVVFDNYLVHYTANTAGTTASNTANWEYVGVTPGTAPTANYVKLSPATVSNQTIKFWDYSQEQYDFLAFSTGTYKAVNGTSAADDEIGVTKMKYGAELVSATAYTFDIPSLDALENTYITDITTVAKANYGKDVTLKFKNIGSKVRIALYETVPGYSVQAASVYFYTEDGTTDFTEYKDTEAALISADATYGFPTDGTIAVSFLNMGSSNSSNQNYNKASVTVYPVAPTPPAEPALSKKFGSLYNKATAEGSEEAGSLYLGRTAYAATYAGDVNADYYKTVFPISTSSPLTLRVDYTLISTDGSGETITIHGAKAVVPSTYTVWQPNYAYTYIFKISDNTNGWTSPDASTDDTDPGLFPITFDAVVAEYTENSNEQKTITTVATPSITTYQQNHDLSALAKDEYSKATGKDVYVQVMDNDPSLASPVLVGTTVGSVTSSKPLLNSTSPYTASLLYAINSGKEYSTRPAGWPTGYFIDALCTTKASGAFSAGTYYKRSTEADVMDALEKRTTGLAEDNVTGRNGLTLTKNSNINAAVTTIVNGPDDNVINLTSAGEAAKLDMTALTAGLYAYVYDYSTSTKTTITEYQPIAVTIGSALGGTAASYHSVTTTALASASVTSSEEYVDNDYIYFSKTTTDGGTTYTYSYISVTGKTTVPKGVVKYAKSSFTDSDLVTKTENAVANTFYFDTYITNNGKYAVKVIKVVN